MIHKEDNIHDGLEKLSFTLLELMTVGGILGGGALTARHFLKKRREKKDKLNKGLKVPGQKPLLKQAGLMLKAKADIAKGTKALNDALASPKKLQEIYEGTIDNFIELGKTPEGAKSFGSREEIKKSIPWLANTESFRRKLISGKSEMDLTLPGIKKDMSQEWSNLYGKHSPASGGEKAIKSLRDVLTDAGFSKTDPEVMKANKEIKELKDLRMDRSQHGYPRKGIRGIGRRRAINRDISAQPKTVAEKFSFLPPGDVNFSQREFTNLPRRLRAETLERSRRFQAKVKSGRGYYANSQFGDLHL